MCISSSQQSPKHKERRYKIFGIKKFFFFCSLSSKYLLSLGAVCPAAPPLHLPVPFGFGLRSLRELRCLPSWRFDGLRWALEKDDKGGWGGSGADRMPQDPGPWAFSPRIAAEDGLLTGRQPDFSLEALCRPAGPLFSRERPPGLQERRIAAPLPRRQHSARVSLHLSRAPSVKHIFCP